jgi:putative FmdB family regulatory protein
MPVYEYLCEGCGERFEVIQKFSDEPLTSHAKCGAPVHRLLSAPALQFKGSGWYVTDYAKNSKPEGDSASKKSDSGSASSSAEGSSSTPSPAPASEKPAAPAPSTTKTD